VSVSFLQRSSQSIPPEYRAQVQATLISFLFEMVTLQVIVNIILGIVVVWIFRNIHPVPLLWGWYASLLLVFLSRAILARTYHIKHPSPDKAKRWGNYFAFNMIATGMVWGSAGFIFSSPDHLIETMTFMMAIAGLSVGAFVSHSAYMPAYLSFVMTAIPPLAWKFYNFGGDANEAMAVFILIFTLVIVVFGRKMHTRLSDGVVSQLKMRKLNIELVGQTELAEKAREDAEAANEAKSRFLASASHDLRQPLYALTLLVAALERKVKDSSVLDLLGNIRSSTDALENLFNSLLDLAKVEAKTIKPEWSNFELNELFERLQVDFGPIAKENGLIYRAVPTRIFVYSDQLLLERILRNLINNAIRYTPQGSVLVGCRRRGERINIEVWDTGIGIENDKLGEIFSEFQQIDNPERDRTKGLGLGLAIADGLSTIIESSITVRSELGKGSCFSIEVPLGHVLPDSSDLQLLPLDTNRLKGRVIAFIDDDQAIRDGMRELLSDWECHVVIGEDDAEVEALLEAKGDVPDLILSDYRLRHGRTGIEAIEQLKARFGENINAAIITGDTASDQLKSINASGYSVLHKPVKPAKLRMLLEQMLV